MSAFTDFIQTELPLRPYLPSDVPANSVIVRQGSGPRQLTGITLGEGEILMNVGGSLQAVVLDDVTGNTDSYVHLQESASSTWTIAHNMNSTTFILQCFDETGKVVSPDEITQIDENTIEVSFTSLPILGKACLAVIRE